MGNLGRVRFVIPSNWWRRKCGRGAEPNEYGFFSVQFFSAYGFFPCMLMKRRKTTTTITTRWRRRQRRRRRKQSARREECTLSACEAKRDWRERIEAACYAGEPNRAGRVLETGRRSILFFSHPFFASSVPPPAPSFREGDAWAMRVRDQRVPLQL